MDKCGHTPWWRRATAIWMSGVQQSGRRLPYLLLVTYVVMSYFNCVSLEVATMIQGTPFETANSWNY